MTHDQLVGWLIVAAIANGSAWLCALAHIYSLRDQLSREQLITAHLRERLEPIQTFTRSHETSTKQQ